MTKLNRTCVNCATDNNSKKVKKITGGIPPLIIIKQ